MKFSTNEYLFDGESVKFSNLIGKTLIEVKGAEKNSNVILFVTSDNEKFKQFHEQDCCESVSVDDIEGDVSDLIGLPLLIADEVTKNGTCEYGSDTWTFYKLATSKGHVTIKWYGSSNGYYSESVDFVKLID